MAEDSSSSSNQNKRKRVEVGPDENDRSKRDLVERYVKAFTQEQLTSILIEIVTQVPDTFEILETYASNEVSHRKIFLRGIGPDTKHDILKDFFTEFGVIEKAEIVVDHVTGKNKGYAFLLYKEIDSVNKALASESYEIDGKTIYVNLAVLGKQYIENNKILGKQLNDNKDIQGIDDVDRRKLFVRSLNPQTTVESLKAHFSIHGEVESCKVVMDKVTKKSKNYGFVIFKNAASTGKALKDNVVVDGKPVVVVLASEGAVKPLDPYQQQMMMAGYAFPAQSMAQHMPPQMVQPMAAQGSYMYAPNGIMQMQPNLSYGPGQHYQPQPQIIPPLPPHGKPQQQRGIYQSMPNHTKW